jgi:hypothetical protein
MARALFNLGAQLSSSRRAGKSGTRGGAFIAPASEVDVLVTGREAPNPTLWDLSELVCGLFWHEDVVDIS